MTAPAAARFFLIAGAAVLIVDLAMTFSSRDGTATHALGVVAGIFVLAGTILRAIARKSIA